MTKNSNSFSSERLVTIEIQGNKIAQVKGKSNRVANIQEQRILNEWKKVTELEWTTVQTYVILKIWEVSTEKIVFQEGSMTNFNPPNEGTFPQQKQLFQYKVIPILSP